MYQEQLIFFDTKDQFDVVVCGFEKAPFKGKVIGLKRHFSNRSHVLCLELAVLSEDNNVTYHNPYDLVDKINI